MRRILLVFSILFLLAGFQPARAQTPAGGIAPGVHLRFEHLTIDDGLSQNAGLALLQDRQGYIWIGTQDGLNRYDGYHITQYKHDPENPNSLSQNSVIALLEDADGYLWVGTWGGGLNRLDPQTGHFTRYLPDPQNPASLSNPIVTDIFQDEQGSVLGGATLGGLDRFDPGTRCFYPFSPRPTEPCHLEQRCHFGDCPGWGWEIVGWHRRVQQPGAGLNLFDPATGKAQRFEASRRVPGSPQHCRHTARPNDDGSLWITFGGYGVPGGGLDHLQPANRSLCPFRQRPHLRQPDYRQQHHRPDL